MMMKAVMMMMMMMMMMFMMIMMMKLFGGRASDPGSVVVRSIPLRRHIEVFLVPAMGVQLFY